MATHLRTPEGARLIEGEGGGLLEIFRSVRERGLKRPQLFDSGVTVTAKLWRGPMFDAAAEAWLQAAAPGRTLSAVQKRLLLGARDGERWDVGRLRREFSPLTLDEARRHLEELVRSGLVEGAEDSALLRLSGPAAAVEGGGAERPPEPSDAVPGAVAGRSDPAEPGPGRGTGAVRHRNAARILEALADGPRSVGGLVHATALTENQVRYALRALLAEGKVSRRGGQGIRDTVYELP